MQEEFFKYISGDVDKYHRGWSRRPTKQWYNCYAKIGKKDRVILWVKQPNSDGSFWVFVSIPSNRIFKIPNVVYRPDMRDDRKFYFSLKNTSMSPTELLDRGLSAKNPWEINWPVGFKIEDKNQFELAKEIILEQWK